MIEPRNPSPHDPPARVLVVDDEFVNRVLLRDLLEPEGHIVLEAGDGAEALNHVDALIPDLVLLDVMMPRLNGLDVCRSLKQNPRSAHVPVLLVTALSDRADRLRGIEAGANDFISKPIDVAEVRLRVRNALHAKRLHDRVQETLDRVREVETLRDNLIHMIVHDMRSPLTVIRGRLELVELMLADRLEEKWADGLRVARGEADLLIEMAQSLLDVSRLESAGIPLNLKPCDLAELSRQVIERLGHSACGRELTVEADEPVLATCDPELIRRVMLNLVTNALKFTPPTGWVRVRFRKPNGSVRVEVADNGRGIPEEDRERIWDKFGQVDAGLRQQRHSTGLGLTFCKLAVEAHGGTVGLESELGRGSTFWCTLPTGPTADES